MVAGGVRGCSGGAWLGVVCGCGGVCMVGGHVWLWGACMVSGGHAWLQGGVWLGGGGMHGCREACVAVGGTRGCWGCVWLLGGCAWLQGDVWLPGECVGYDEIRSMSARYTSYWNAFLLFRSLTKVHFVICRSDRPAGSFLSKNRHA